MFKVLSLFSFERLISKSEIRADDITNDFFKIWSMSKCAENCSEFKINLLFLS